MFRKILNIFRENHLERLKARFEYKVRKSELKFGLYDKSHSLLWVWEFSKKAVLICFAFYAIIQVYSMTVMFVYQDFTYLSDLITQAGELVRDCVFGYLVKAGVENIGKILISKREKEEEDEVDE